MTWKRGLLAASSALIVSGCGAPDVAGPGAGVKVGGAVSNALAGSASVRVVVALKEPEASATALSERGQEVATAQDSVLSALTTSDFRVTRRYQYLPAMAGEVSPAGLARLEAHPAVLKVDLDGVKYPTLSESGPLIHADEARGMGYTGRDVIVAVVDTGVDASHPDLAVSMASERCFCTGCCPGGGSTGSGSGSARDDDGHGTHVSGTIAAPGIAQPVGVAPGSYIAAVKVLGPDGGRDSDILAGLDWVLSRSEIKVVNMSLGGGRYSRVCDNTDSVNQAYASVIAALRARGTLTSVASGNEAYTDSVASPACINAALAVGAVYDSNVGGRGYGDCSDPTTAADQVACFSNSCPLVELLAPGSRITAAAMGGGTATLSGTSMAAPHVAGAAAVLLQANPGLTPSQIIDILKRTGRSVTDTRNGLTLPRIDLAAAVRAAR
jgi:subtilisin family serine protease